MIVPSGLKPPTAESVFFYEVAPGVMADWLCSLDPAVFQERAAAAAPLLGLVEATLPRAPFPERRFLCLGLGEGWTAILTNDRLGSDMGVLPARAAHQLGCRAIRALATSPGDVYPATILEVFGPDGDPERRQCRRVVSAANDGGRWRFDEFGEPFGFEQVDRYAARRKRDRFTSEMLEQYLLALGVPPLEADSLRGPNVLVRLPNAVHH